MSKGSKTLLIVVIIVVIIVAAIYFTRKKKPVQSETGVPISANPLVIVKATYGSTGSVGSANIDVTSAVQNLVKNNALVINPQGQPGVLNSIFSDPSPGIPKALNIDTNIGGGISHYTFTEITPVKVNAQ